MSRNKDIPSKAILNKATPNKATHHRSLGTSNQDTPSRVTRHHSLVTISQGIPNKATRHRRLGTANQGILNKDTLNRITNHLSRYLSTPQHTYHLEETTTVLLNHRPRQRVATAIRPQHSQSNHHLSQRNPPRLRSQLLNPQS